MKRIISLILSLVLIMSICSPCMTASAQEQDYEQYLKEYLKFLKETTNSDDIYTDSILAAVGEDELEVDGEEILIPEPIENSSDEALIPIRPVAEAMGKKISYTQEDNTVTILDNDLSVAAFSLSDNEAVLPNDTNCSTEVLPYLKNGVTYLSLDDVSEVLGCSAEYDNQDKTISIERPFQSKSIIVNDDLTEIPVPDNGKAFETIHGYSILSFKTERETKLAYEELLEDGFLTEPVLLYSSAAQTAADTTGASALSNAIGIGPSSFSVKVAVIDSGIEKTHSFLKDSLVDVTSLTDETCTDKLEHGTHVAGIVHTFAPYADIMPIKVFDDSTDKARSDTISEAIYLAIEKDVDVINMSLGGEGYSSMLVQAVRSAYNQGVSVVAAAGNETLNLSNTSYMPATISECITVSAVDRNGNIASFSNYGNCVDIAAYGVDIYSSVPGNTYTYYDGTSMAAPEVAGAVALLMSLGFSAREAENMILSGTVAPNSSNSDYYGNGILGNLDSFIKEIGKCGENATWDLDENGVLTISGSGAMYDYAYNTLPWFELRDTIKSVVFEEGITYIGAYALLRSSTLEGAVIPDSVTAIGENAFSQCTSLKNITLPEALTSIGAEAFANCISLPDITIPSGVTAIGERVFSGCSGFTDITIPEGVTTIGERAFYSCKNLKSITLPDTVTSIDSYAFFYCTSLENMAIPNSVTSMGDSVFWGCSKLEAVTLSENMTAIDSNTFYGCTALADITVPNSITAIGNSTFRSCTSLTDITLPDSVTSVSEYTFAGCTGLASITISGNVTEINESAFLDCSSLTDIYYSGKEENWNNITIAAGNDALSSATIHYLGMPVKGITLNTSSVDLKVGNTYQIVASIIPDNATIRSVTWTTSNKSIADVSDGMVTARSVGIADITATTLDGGYTAVCRITVTQEGSCGENSSWTLDTNGHLTISGNGGIDAKAFMDRTTIKSVVIEEGITSIGDFAFLGLTNLESITISDTVTYIGVQALRGCPKLETITIPSGVTSIEKYTFWYCTALKTVMLPGTITAISIYAFSDCKNLTDVYFNGLRQDWEKIEEISNNAILNKAAIHCLNDVAVGGITLNKSNVSIGKGNTHTLVASIYPENATNKTVSWSTSKSSVATVANGIVTAKSTGTADITVTTLEGGYTATCTVTVVKGGTCGEKVTWMLEDNGCLTIEGSGAMTDYAYRTNPPWQSYKSSVRSVVIADGVTSVGNYTFYKCTNLTSVTISDSVTSIGGCAFENTKISGITIPDSVTSIGDYAFSNCASLADLVIPDSVTIIGMGAFNNCSSLTDITIPDGVTAIEGHTFKACSNLTSITIPDKVTSIGVYAFSDCKKLTDITIPDGVTFIGGYAFYGCNTLANITIPEGVTTIEGYAFYSCFGFTDFTVPDSVTIIGMGAFNNCTNLAAITIPSSVTTIEGRAFENCNGLKNVYYTGTQDDWSNITIKTYNDPLKNASVHFITPTPTIKQFKVAKIGNTASVEISTKYIPENSSVFVAAYENGRFSQKLPITLDESGNAQTDFAVTNENRFKLFVWDSMQTLKPICQAEESGI